MAQLQQFANNATTTVPSTISSGATSITVAAGTGALFPTLSGGQFFVVTIVNTIASDPGFGQLEIVRCTARSGDVLTVTRAQEGTTAKNFPAACLLELRPTKQSFDNIYTAKADLDSPVFTGNPTAPTPSPGDNDTSLATTAFVTAALAAATGRLIGVRTITSTQAYTPTAGTNSIVVWLVGSGGGGGGCGAPAASQASVGSGGGGGGIAVSRFTSGFSGVTITIGVGGGGGSGAVAGTQGGASTFNGMTAGGGSGGLSQTPTGSLVAFGGGQGGVATGGNLLNIPGAPGGPAIISGFIAGQSVAGNGGSGQFGSGGTGVTANSGNAAAGLGFGSGGAGASASSGAGPYTAGNGTQGVAFIWEFA